MTKAFCIAAFILLMMSVSHWAEGHTKGFERYGLISTAGIFIGIVLGKI